MSWSIQLSDGLRTTRQTLLQPNDPFDQVAVLRQDRKLLRVLAKLEGKCGRRDLDLAVSDLGQEEPLGALLVAKTLEGLLVKVRCVIVHYLAGLGRLSRGVDLHSSHVQVLVPTHPFDLGVAERLVGRLHLISADFSAFSAIQLCILRCDQRLRTHGSSCLSNRLGHVLLTRDRLLTMGGLLL